LRGGWGGHEAARHGEHLPQRPLGYGGGSKESKKIHVCIVSPGVVVFLKGFLP